MSGPDVAMHQAGTMQAAQRETDTPSDHQQISNRERRSCRPQG
jgi:hypothetical protein